MAIKLTKKPAEATVSVEKKDGGKPMVESQHQEPVAVPTKTNEKQDSAVPMAEVGLETSYTANLGNYQSAKVGVSLKVQCAVDEIDVVFDFTQNWVDTRMKKLIAEVTEG
jgi:hypothetical protein